MPSKRPPVATMEAIYAACAVKRRCIEIADATGIKHVTVKAAIAWMKRNGFLVGHRKSTGMRHMYYSQGKPVDAMNKDEKRMCLDVLEECWPLSMIRAADVKPRPSIVHKVK